ncbi:MAG: nucleotide exchange factor GrpE [Alphaproteobacteria bacterium]|nr:nucleotide exchange factor GrpE [Alphaproteobacteria bacterium]
MTDPSDTDPRPEPLAPEEGPPDGEGPADRAAPDALAALQAELAEVKDKALRAMADAENTRRRAEREKAEAQKFAITRFARDLLSVADNFRRALAALPEAERAGASEGVKTLFVGVEMIERELAAVLERHGVRSVDPKGEKFDPNLHQAVSEVPGNGAPAGTVVDVFQTGYVIEDRLLRPAMVTVSRGVGSTAGPSGAGEGPQPGSTIDTKA